MAPARALALAAIAVASGGCAAIGTSGARRGPVATAEAAHEYPAPKPPAQRAPGAAAPEQALLAFATAYIDWTAGTVTQRLLALAAAGVGQARSAMELAAAQTAGDYELRRGGIANHGTVEAIAPLGRPGYYVVVTREATTATGTAAYQGLKPAWHVTVAGVRREAGGGWVVSAWQPEG